MDLSDKDEIKKIATIPYIPEIAHQNRRSLSKAGINTNFKSAPKLSDILCGKNKTHPPKDKNKGLYKYTCPCSPTAVYIGQTSRSFKTRWEEHHRASVKEQWSHSGITQHLEHCSQNFEKDNFEVVQTMQGKKKKRLIYDLKIRESMEIRRHGCGPGRGLNEDMGSYIKTDIWDPVLNTI